MGGWFCKTGGGVGTGLGGRNWREVLTLAVERPALFRPRLTVLNFMAPSAGVPLMAVTFRGAAALGIGGASGGEVEGEVGVK